MNFKDVFSAVAAVGLMAASIPMASAQSPVPPPVVLNGSLVGYPYIEVRGMTLYSPNDTWQYAQAHLVQTQGQVTAVEMAKAIELIYREDGYFLARVHIVPGVQPGTAVLLVEEGHVGSIEVTGVDERTGQRIASYMKPVVDKGPVRLADFERALMLAGDLGGVSVRSEITYTGGDMGKPDLKLHAKAVKSRGSIVIDSPPAADSLTATALQEFYSTFFAGDMLRAIVGGATDFNQSGLLP